MFKAKGKTVIPLEYCAIIIVMSVLLESKIKLSFFAIFCTLYRFHIYSSLLSGTPISLSSFHSLNKVSFFDVLHLNAECLPHAVKTMKMGWHLYVWAEQMSQS